MIGYDYRCQQCAHEWVLFSKRFSLGLTVWGQIKYECFNCETRLAIVAAPDFHSWTAWRRKHEAEIARNESLAELAQAIDIQLSKTGQFTPVELRFDSVACPTCREPMSTRPFGQHLMKCPQCGQFAGEFDDRNGISIYGACEEYGQTDKPSDT